MADRVDAPGVAGAGGAPGAADGRRLLRATDVFALRFLAEVAVSPDGARIACVERRVDEHLDGMRSRVLLVEVASGEVRSLSPDDASDSAPRWTADGRALAFQASRDEGSGPRVAETAGGSGRPWPGVPAGAGAFTVAPDGEAIVVVVARDDAPDDGAALWEVTGPGWHHDGVPTVERRPRASLWRVEADGRARPLTTPDPGIHDRAPAFSPDGRWVAFLSDRPVAPGGRLAGTALDHPMARPVRLWLIAADGNGDPFPVLPPVALAAFAWAPDSAVIAWLGTPEPALPGVAARLRITTLEDGATREVPLPGVPAPGAAVRSDDSRGYGDTPLAWTRDGRIWLRWADGGASRIGWVDVATGALGVVVGGDRAALAFGVSPDGRVVGHVTADAGHPGDLAVCAADGTGERPLTDRNAWLREIRLGATRHFTAAGPDGLPLEGWVVEPPAGAPGHSVEVGAPAPVVLSVHGGPHYPIGWRFSFESHRLAARGYAVVNGNARGSTGYGDAHATAIHGDWGSRDLGDTYAILDAALAPAPGAVPLDAARVAITGVSYGGYLTNWAIANGERFRAAIAENSISDLASTFGSAEDDGGFWIAELGATPWSSPAAYVDRSPLFRADRIHTPLLLLHAEEDHNCPIAQSEELYSALARLGRPVRFVRARGVGHLMNFFGSGRFRLARAGAIDEWLDRWLAGPDEGGDR
ncbi:MAG: S9 family peptidase [Chloroflexota bacterium]